MHIYEYIQHPCTTLHLTGRAPKPVKVNDGRVGLNGRIGLAIGAVMPGTGDAGAAGGFATPGLPAETPGTAGA